MKKPVAFVLAALLIGILGCNNSPEEAGFKDYIKRNIFEAYQITPVNDRSIYLLLIHDRYVCFPCSSIYRKVFKHFRKLNFPSSNVIIIFNNKRKIERKYYLSKKVEIDPAYYSVFFDSGLLKNIKEKKGLSLRKNYLIWIKPEFKEDKVIPVDHPHTISFKYLNSNK